MATPIFGVLSVRVKGKPLEIAGDWVFSPGGTSRESKLGSNGVVGMKISPTVPYAEGTVFDRGDVSLEDLRGIQDAPATLHMRNGKTYFLRGASQVGELEVNLAEGEIRVRLEAIEGGEVMP